MEKIKLFEMFAGYGGASFALKKAGVDYETVGYSEIDKFAIQCYEQNHGNVKNYGDCTKINVNELPDFDLLTGGFPCQDVSVNGKGDLDKGRTILVQDILRILEAKQPKYILLENVKGILQEKHKSFLNSIVNRLEKIGYNLNIELYNSSEFGVLQNRDRVYIIGCLDRHISSPKKTHKKIKLRTVDRDGNKIKSPRKQLDRVYDISCGIPCLTASFNRRFVYDGDKVREMSGKEMFYYQGFKNNEIDLTGLSENNLRKLAGNGWDVNLVSQIFTQMFKKCE